MKKFINCFLIMIFVSGAIQLLAADNIFIEGSNMKSIVDVLKKNEIEFYTFSNSQGNELLVVPRFGARIFAVSVGGENLFWVHPDVLKGQGGQRSWISPEGGAKGFLFKPDWTGNRDFSMMDPGDYKVASFKKNEHLALCNSFKTTSNDGKEKYDLRLTREMRIAEDPLRYEPEFEELNYQFLGINFVHKLKNNSETFFDRILALWSLIQIPPKGTMIIPVHEAKREAWRSSYFEPIPEEYVKANSDSFSYFIHGSRRYKVGIRPESAKGAVCYLSKTEDKDYAVVFMTFPVKPEARYTDRPKTEQETNGDAIQIYSHLEKGPLAFGELECQSWGLELRPGEEKAFPINIYMYKSSLETLKKIGEKLVCPEFDKNYIFE